MAGAGLCTTGMRIDLGRYGFIRSAAATIGYDGAGVIDFKKSDLELRYRMVSKFDANISVKNLNQT
jgi:hypothetical protein